MNMSDLIQTSPTTLRLSIIQPVSHALGRHWLVQGTHSRNVHIGEVLAEKHAVKNKLLAFII